MTYILLYFIIVIVVSLIWIIVDFKDNWTAKQIIFLAFIWPLTFFALLAILLGMSIDKFAQKRKDRRSSK